MGDISENQWHKELCMNHTIKNVLSVGYVLSDKRFCAINFLAWTIIRTVIVLLRANMICHT